MPASRWREVFPHLAFVRPAATSSQIEDADWGAVDAVFCGLPHGTTQEITKEILDDHPKVKIIDMSADFRLRDPETYKKWYGARPCGDSTSRPRPSTASPSTTATAIAEARLVACPGCYPDRRAAGAAAAGRGPA